METSAPAQASDAAPAAPTPAPAPVAPAAAPAAPVTVPAKAPDVAKLEAVNDIDAALEANFLINPTEKVPMPGEKPAAAAAPVTVQPVAEVPPAPAAVPETTPVETDEGKILPNRIPTNQFDDQTRRALILMHALNEGKKPGDQGYVLLKDCIGRIETADAPPAPVAAPVAAQLDKVTKVTNQVAEYETQLDDVATQIKEFQANPELYGEELAEARREQDKLEIRLESAKERLGELQEAVEEAEKSRVVDAKAKAILAAEGRYPYLADRAGDLRTIANKMMRELQSPDHPEHAILSLPSAPTIVADRVAHSLAQARAATKGTTFAQELANLMAKPGTAAPAAPAPVAAPVAEPRKILPGTGSGGTEVVQPKTAMQKVAEVGEDWQKAEALLDGGNDPYVIR